MNYKKISSLNAPCPNNNLNKNNFGSFSDLPDVSQMDY